LHKAFALRGELPVWETDLSDNVVDVVDDALDDYVGVGILRVFKKLGQRLLGTIPVFERISKSRAGKRTFSPSPESFRGSFPIRLSEPRFA
jgi:hypothetical protein